MKFIGECVRCGEELYEGIDYCPECGSPVSEDAWNEANARKYREDYDVVLANDCEHCDNYEECSCHDGLCE